MIVASETEAGLRKRLKMEIEAKEQRLKELKDQAIKTAQLKQQATSSTTRQTPQQLAALKRKAQMEALPMRKNAFGADNQGYLSSLLFEV